MLRRSFILSFTLFALVLTWFSCTEDNDPASPSLNGRWQIEEALRNGRTTESLVDLYLVFGEDGGFETNLSGQPERGSYVFEEELITTSDVSIAMDYQVTELTDSTLHLKSNYRNFRFDFTFQRAIEIVKPETSITHIGQRGLNLAANKQ